MKFSTGALNQCLRTCFNFFTGKKSGADCAKRDEQPSSNEQPKKKFRISLSLRGKSDASSGAEHGDAASAQGGVPRGRGGTTSIYLSSRANQEGEEKVEEDHEDFATAVDRLVETVNAAAGSSDDASGSSDDDSVVELELDESFLELLLTTSTPPPEDAKDWKNNNVDTSHLPTFQALKGKENGLSDKYPDTFACQRGFLGSNSATGKIVVVGTFPPSKRKLHKKGTLHTGGRNSLPQIPSMHALFKSLAEIISRQYGIPYERAELAVIHCVVVVDICPFTLPCDIIEKDRKEYDRIVESVSVQTVAYMEDVFKEHPNIGAVVALGESTYDFIIKKCSKFITSDKLCQYGTVMHPTVHCVGSGFQPTERQAHESLFTMNRCIALAIGGQPKPITMGLATSVYSTRQGSKGLFGDADRSDDYIYFLSYEDTFICVIGWTNDTKDWLRVRHGLKFDNRAFPSQKNIIDSGFVMLDELTSLHLPTIEFCGLDISILHHELFFLKYFDTVRFGEVSGINSLSALTQWKNKYVTVLTTPGYSISQQTDGRPYPWYVRISYPSSYHVSCFGFFKSKEKAEAAKDIALPFLSGSNFTDLTPKKVGECIVNAKAAINQHFGAGECKMYRTQNKWGSMTEEEFQEKITGKEKNAKRRTAYKKKRSSSVPKKTTKK